MLIIVNVTINRGRTKMSIIPRSFFILIIGLIGMAFSSPAGAAYYDVTATIGTTPTDFTIPLSLQSFNSSMGTLTSVVITYSDNGTMSGFVQNNAPTPQNFTVTEESKDKLSFGGTTLLSNSLIGQQAFTQLGSGDMAQFSQQTSSGVIAPTTITSGPLFNAFLEPSSTVMLSFSTLTSTSVVGGGGNIDTGIYTDVGATVTVTFYYMPNSVPEPTSLALTTIGGLSLAASRFRKRRNP
jgi:hypothetical protein